MGDFKKQDCERKAFKRLAVNLKAHFPRLPMCLATDGLYPNKPFFDMCRQYHWNFIVTFEEGNLPSVWKTVERLQSRAQANTFEETFQQGKKMSHRAYSWINELDYRGQTLHWFECIETVAAPKKKTTQKHFVCLTNLVVKTGNIVEMVRTGRLRWKIEHEGFNTQKNVGYRLQHKYSRCSWLGSKNYDQCVQIAHLLNQLVELSESCKELLLGSITLKHLWKCLIGFLTHNTILNADIAFLNQVRTQMRFE